MIKKMILAAGLLLGTVGLYAEVPGGELSAQLAQVKTAQSRFTEEKHLSLFTRPLVSEGILIFDKAAQKLRWEYQKPFAKGFIIEGKKIFRVQNGQKLPVKNALGRTAAAQMMVWLTLDIDELVKTYRLTREEDKLVFTPLNPANDVIAHITVWIERSEKIPRVSAVQITEKNGDFTRFNFTQSVLNGPVPAEAFE